MDVSFVVAALRKYFWVVALFAFAGFIVGGSIWLRSDSDFESTAVLAVRPSTGGGSVFFGDMESYVLGQLNVLESPTMASAVSAVLSEVYNIEIDPDELALKVTIEAEPLTDLVGITARSTSPETAAQLAQTYAEVYLASLPTQRVDEAQLAQLKADEARLKSELEALDSRIEAAMRPFLPAEDDPPDVALPTADMVDPSGVSQRLLVQAQLEQITSTLIALDVDSRVTVNSAILADAPIPGEPTSQTVDLIPAAAILGGLFAGVVAALVSGRLSPRVLDARAVGELFQTRVVDGFSSPRSRNLGAIAASRPNSEAAAIDEVCVRVEEFFRSDEATAVAVTGAERGSGITTLAASLAGRLASRGSRVLLVDGDLVDPTITTSFGLGGAAGIRSKPEHLRDEMDSPQPFPDSVAPVTGLAVLGAGPESTNQTLTAGDAIALLDSLRSEGDVIVIDCGPLLNAASSAKFAELADLVLIAVPLGQQRIESLQRVSSVLQRHHNLSIPVITKPRKHRPE